MSRDGANQMRQQAGSDHWIATDRLLEKLTIRVRDPDSRRSS